MKNKRFIITIVICITLVITFVLLTSYAYWKVEDTQTGTNDIKGACLDIELEQYIDPNTNEEIDGIELKNAWPMSDTSGGRTAGYKFKVINKCPDEVIYEVILDSLPVTEGKEINSHYVSVYLEDMNSKLNYRFLSRDRYDNYDEAEIANTGYAKLDSRKIYTGVVPAATASKNGEVEHNIKLWISEDSTNDDIGKEFSSKVRVVAGQNLDYITPEWCFAFDSETGTILDYDEEACSKKYLVVPETINGVIVKSIDLLNENSEYNLNYYSDFDYIDLSKATGLETIEDYAFLGFNGYKLILGNGLKTIGLSAFREYTGVESLIIPEGVETIGYEAFMNFGIVGFGSKYAYPVYLPSTITEIEDYAFPFVRKVFINMTEEDFNNNVQKRHPWSISTEVIFLKQ